MYNLEFIFTLLLVTSVKFSENRSFTSVVPIGEYQIDVLKIIECAPNKQKNLHVNWYINKLSATSSEFKGNITIENIPFDDNITLHINLDSKDSMGRWSSSPIIMKKEKGCSDFVSLINPKYCDGFGWNFKCPRIPGVYETPGFPATNLDKALLNIPKVAPYGIYKLRVSMFTKNNELYSCFNAIMDVKRPQGKP